MKQHLLIPALVSLGLTLSVAAQDVNQSTDRLLKTGDVLSVTLGLFEGNQVTYMTHANAAIIEGKLNVPLLGQVQASGLTVEELQQLLQGRYAKSIKERHGVEITVGQTDLTNFKFLPPPLQPKKPKFIPIAPPE